MHTSNWFKSSSYVTIKLPFSHQHQSQLLLNISLIEPNFTVMITKCLHFILHIITYKLYVS